MRTIYVLLVAALVAVGMAACSKDDKTVGSTDENSVGEVRVTLGFEKSAESKAITPSSAKPTTSWKGNIKDLMILFARTSDGKVIDARKILSLPTATGIGQETFTLTNVKASAPGDPYTVYVIANSQQNGIKAEKNGGGTWDANKCVGSKISDLLMKLVVNPVFIPHGTAEAGATGYSEPAEIFVGKQANVEIADSGSPANIVVAIQRAISMMRVRINKSLNGNNVVDFTGNTASFRIRRATTTINPNGTLNLGSKTDVLYTKSPFLTEEPASGYQGGNILNSSENITLWKDIRMLPGGSENTSAEKFDIVLIGRAPEGYIALGDKKIPSGGGDVAWSAAVSTTIGANAILEINLTLERSGTWVDDPDNPGIPEVGIYGDADVNVNLVPWGNIVSEDIPV